MVVYNIADGDKLEKVHVALLFNSGTSALPNWVQLCKATDNTITLNAETEDLDFIVDKNPTTIIKRYKPSINNPLTCYKGSPDYEYFWPKFYNLPTGADANGEILVVFMNDETEGAFKAWRCPVTFVLDNLNPVDSSLTMTTQFNGTITKGTVTVTAGVPTFTEESAASDDSDEDTDGE